ncbi:MAG: DUF1343 domain-containing protein [Burkholderiales bacterium]|nr:DUF1343 domain-containing protein [Burkholderiales bacterium]
MMSWTRLFHALLITALLACLLGGAPAVQAQAPSNWAPLDAAVEAQIQAGQLPGAVLIWGDANGIRLERSWGHRAVAPHPEPMTVDTVFDLASLTKVIATTTAILQLADKGRVQLDAPAARYWPAFGTLGKEQITLRQLLAHTSGLRPDLDLRPDWTGTAQALKRVIAERPVAPPGTRTIYSDLNFIVLGQIVQRVSHMPLPVYARQKIFQPLHMHDTAFLPPRTWQARLAPTESLKPGAWLRGVVHDPTARRMDGVAGHAGLFGTAEDLARFAQAMLEPGRLLKASTLNELQQRQNPSTDPDARGLGWQVMAPLVANRDDWPPEGMIGHTGYTGTGLWIDLTQKQFVILLSNRVHPDGRGDARPLRRQVLALLSSVQSPLPVPPHPAWTPSTPEGVLTGSDVLRAQGFAPLVGHRVGLITNLAAIDRQGWRTLDRLRWAPGVTLVKVFSPEHGLYGDAEGAIASGREPISDLPLISLYGERKRPTADSLRDIDTLVFDLQDAGARFFTYISTLAEAMRAAAEQGIRVVVLDRPNPIRADRIGGPVLEAGLASFTGYPGLPVQHGMTVGELARWFQDDLKQKGLNVNLDVVPMQGYRRSQWFDQTHVDWVPPSPNLRRPLTAILYPGVSWVEGANVSVGRGTDHPFEWLGAPWIDGPRLAEALSQAAIPGVRFRPIQFTPHAGPYQDELCSGVQIQVIDRNAFDAPQLGALLIKELEHLWPDSFLIDKTLGMIGSDDTLRRLKQGDSLDSIVASWQADLTAFDQRRQRYLLYP